jgi:hypothetical protein
MLARPWLIFAVSESELKFPGPKFREACAAAHSQVRERISGSALVTKSLPREWALHEQTATARTGVLGTSRVLTQGQPKEPLHLGLAGYQSLKGSV